MSRGGKLLRGGEQVYKITEIAQHRYRTPYNKAQIKAAQNYAERKKFISYLCVLNIKRIYDKCCICGWDETEIDLAHLEPKGIGGEYEIDNIVPLCPNHHRLLDRNNTTDEQNKIIKDFLRKARELVDNYITTTHRRTESRCGKLARLPQWQGDYNAEYSTGQISRSNRQAPDEDKIGSAR